MHSLALLLDFIAPWTLCKPTADVAVTTAAIPGRRAPVLITEAMVGAMRPGSVIVDLAAATGGLFFHHNNDVDEGFRRTAVTPEYSYTLAFSPGSLKLNGHFHRLKVKVNGGAKLRVQARKGYYAPKKKP